MGSARSLGVVSSSSARGRNWRAIGSPSSAASISSAIDPVIATAYWAATRSSAGARSASISPASARAPTVRSVLAVIGER